jgi:G6PDH family F420-dependent oxidoreductase
MIGYFLSSEEYDAGSLIDQARRAQDAGFEALWISDHYHPWNDEQGQSPFVWSVIGALSQAVDLPVTTAVTCPTLRIHPAVIAQAAATAATLLPAGFNLGVGSGEALNEHIFGDAWPEVDVRLEMLEEAIEVIRKLWTGELVSHRGKHYTVSNARIYSLPEQLPDILVSGFGEKSIELAGRVGDGFMSVQPNADAVSAFRRASGGKRTQAGLKVCWAQDVDTAVRDVHRLWPNELLEGQLSQELALPSWFAQASALVTEDLIRQSPTPKGPDVAAHVQAISSYLDAGFDEVYVGQIGGRFEGFFQAYADEVLPALKKHAALT